MDRNWKNFSFTRLDSAFSLNSFLQRINFIFKGKVQNWINAHAIFEVLLEKEHP